MLAFMCTAYRFGTAVEVLREVTRSTNCGCFVPLLLRKELSFVFFGEGLFFFMCL